MATAACTPQVAEGGGVQAALSALGAWPHSAEVAKAALGALRQLSNSDTVKKLLAESGGIEKVSGASEGAYPALGMEVSAG